jgi:hypothetical protein
LSPVSTEIDSTIPMGILNVFGAAKRKVVTSIDAWSAV